MRALPIERVVTYALSISNPNLLYAVSSREIVLFDWTTSKEVRRSASSVPIGAIAVARISETKQDTIFAIHREESEEGLRDHITVQSMSSPAVRLFFVSMQTLKYLKVLDNGRTIIAASETHLCIGTLSGAALNASTELSDLPSRYVWRKQKSVEPVTCLDAQVRTASSSGSSKKQRLIVDLVFGNLKGEIIVYEDIVHKLEENEKLKGKDNAPKPIVSHWHREAPATVKWSLDGKSIACITVRIWLTCDRQLCDIWWQGDGAVLVATRDIQASTPPPFDFRHRVPQRVAKRYLLCSSACG